MREDVRPVPDATAAPVLHHRHSYADAPGAAVDQNSMEEHPRTKWLDRDEDHSHDVMNTAKLVTTFAAGIAAAFVGAGLQQGTPTNWDKAATALLCVTLLATICVLLTRKETL